MKNDQKGSKYVGSFVSYADGVSVGSAKVKLLMSNNFSIVDQSKAASEHHCPVNFPLEKAPHWRSQSNH